MSDKHIRALREAARRARGRLAEQSLGGSVGEGPAAYRRADLERSARRAAVRLASAGARRRRGSDA